MKKTLLIFGILFLSFFKVSAEQINIYWLCNSFTGGTALQTTVKNMINSNPACGKTVNLSDANILWGQNLDAHWASATSMAAVRSGNYQYVVLQGYVNVSNIAVVAMRDSAVSAGYRISNEVKAHAAIPLIFSTQANCNSTPQQWDYVTNAFRQLADTALATFIPAGLSWLEVKTLSPGFVTHQIDCHHASEEGNYLNACVFYYKITGFSPVGLSYKTSNDSTFSDSKALLMQQAAANVVERELATVVHVSGVSVLPTTTSLMEGSSLAVAATVAPTNARDKTLVWTSSNPDVASVNALGTVVGLSLGNTTITATANDGGFSAQCALNVIVSTLTRVTSIVLEAPTATMEVKQTRTLTATIAPSNASNKNVNWLSSNPLVATVSANGLITALTVGVTKITVTSEDGLKSSECMLTVNADVTAPSVPTNLSNGTVTGNSVVLNWTASTDVVGVTGYDVYKGPNLVGSTASTNYTVTGLSANTNYSFTVKAKDFANNRSSASTALSVTTGDAPAGFRYLKLTAIAPTGGLDVWYNEIEWMDGASSYPNPKLTVSSASVTSPDPAGQWGAADWKAFDGDIKNGYVLPDAINKIYPYSITLDLGAGNGIYPTAIKIAIAYVGRSLSAFKCDGSNDKSTWTNLLTVNGKVESDWVGDAVNSFVIPPQVPTSAATLDKCSVTFYPNPVLDQLNLNFGLSVEKADITILDLQGRSLMTRSVANTTKETIDVNGLSNGTYFVKVVADGKVMNSKFVKK